MHVKCRVANLQGKTHRILIFSEKNLVQLLLFSLCTVSLLRNVTDQLKPIKLKTFLAYKCICGYECGC
jgi:hypothetical protein